MNGNLRGILALAVLAAGCNATAGGGADGGTGGTTPQGDVGTGGTVADGGNTGGTTPDAAPGGTVVPDQGTTGGVQADVGTGGVITPDAAGGVVPPVDAGVGGVETDAIAPDGGQVLPPEVCADLVNLNDSAQADGSFLYSGTTTGGNNAHMGSCGGDAAPDVAFTFTAPAEGDWVFSTAKVDPNATTFDTVLYVRTDCTDPNTESDCNDDSGSTQSEVTVHLAANQEASLVVDGFGENAGDFVLSAFVRQTLNQGDACEAGNARAVCAEGLVCVDAVNGVLDGSFVCAAPVPPTLTTVEPFYNAATQTFAVRATGTDPDGDLEGLHLAVFDDTGAEIALDFFGQGGGIDVPFDVIDRNGADITGTIIFQADLSTAVNGEFFLFDAAPAGTVSDPPVTADILPPPVSNEGESCDISGAFSACDSGANLACDAMVGSAVGTCIIPVEACADVFNVTAIALDPMTGAGSVDGNLANAVNDNTWGSCSTAGAPENVHTLTATVAGAYVISFSSDDVDAAFTGYLRKFCDVEDISTELGCGNLTADGLPASITVDLVAGQTVSVFVEPGEGPNGPWQGNYTISAFLDHAPEIVDATVYFNSENSAFGFEVTGSDIDNNIAGIGVVVSDPSGMVVLANDDGSPVDVAANADEIVDNGDGTVTIRMGRVATGITADMVGLLTIDIYDSAGVRSDKIDVAPIAPPVLAEGDACTADGAFGACDVGLSCATDDTGAGTCAAAIIECPAAFGDVVDLNDPANVVADGSWSYSGDTTNSADNAAGTCGGDGTPDNVHQFVAPAAGDYTFVTVLDPAADPPRDTVLYVTTACGTPIAGEVDCNDDSANAAPGELYSEVTATLDAGQTYYVFVDGYGGSAGPYTLNVTAN